MTAKITPKSKEHLGSQYHPRPQTVHRFYSFPVTGITAASTNEDRDHPKLSSRLRIWTSTNLRQLSRTLMIQTELLLLLNSKSFNSQLNNSYSHSLGLLTHMYLSRIIVTHRINNLSMTNQMLGKNKLENNHRIQYMRTLNFSV